LVELADKAGAVLMQDGMVATDMLQEHLAGH
jgi:hypothetical protein